MSIIQQTLGSMSNTIAGPALTPGVIWALGGGSNPIGNSLIQDLQTGFIPSPNSLAGQTLPEWGIPLQPVNNFNLKSQLFQLPSYVQNGIDSGDQYVDAMLSPLASPIEDDSYESGYNYSLLDPNNLPFAEDLNAMSNFLVSPMGDDSDESGYNPPNLPNTSVNDDLAPSSPTPPTIDSLTSPVYRFQNTRLGAYLFSGEAESQSIRENHPEFHEEGLAFHVAVAPGDNLIPIYRFQNTQLPGTYLFVGEAESANIRANHPMFKEEGLAFYVLDSNANLGTQMYRFQNATLPGTYLFVGATERDSILANFPNLVLEGEAFEVI